MSWYERRKQDKNASEEEGLELIRRAREEQNPTFQRLLSASEIAKAKLPKLPPEDFKLEA